MMTKSIDYIARVDLNDNSAQSLQIKEMIHELNQQADYLNVITMNNINISKFKTISQLKLILLSIKSKSRFAFTRNLIIGLAISFFKKSTFIELHQVPKAILVRLLYLFKFNVKFLFISQSLMLLSKIPSGYKQFYFHDCINHSLICDQYQNNFIKNQAVYTGAFHKGRDVLSLEPLFKFYKDWTFLLIGAKDSELVFYRERFSKYKNVIVKPRVSKEKIIEIQRNAELLLLPLTKSNPLYRVTSPLKLFEYLASSRPILMSSIGSLNELKDEFNFYSYDDNKSIINAFKEYIDEDKENLKTKIGDNIKHLKKNYTWSKRVKFIMEKIHV